MKAAISASSAKYLLRTKRVGTKYPVSSRFGRGWKKKTDSVSRESLMFDRSHFVRFNLPLGDNKQARVNHENTWFRKVSTAISSVEW